MHGPVLLYVKQMVDRYRLTHSELVVEIGSRNLNGTVRPLFQNAPYIGVDILPGIGVDVVADGADYVPPKPADAVVCCEVLEHTQRAPDIVANALRMLKPGGVFIVTVATTGRDPHSGFDGRPLAAGHDEYYSNVTQSDLQNWLSGFEGVEMELHRQRGDLYAVGTKPDVGVTRATTMANDDGEPIPGYDDMNVGAIVQRLRSMDDAMKIRVRDYETKNKARVGVLRVLE